MNTPKRASRKSGPAILALVALAMLLLPDQISLCEKQGTASPKDPKIESLLNSKAKEAPAGNRLLPVIIQFEADSFDAEQDSIIQGCGGKSKNHYPGLATAVGDLDPAALDALAANPRVRRISYDHAVQANLNTTVQAIGADQVRALDSAISSVDGTGVTVAVIDSGIAMTGDLSGSVLSPQIAFGQREAIDRYGHGTHVAGIITGDGTLSVSNAQFSSRYVGVAPGASVLNLRVLDGAGAGLTSNVLAALDWCLRNKNLYNIRVINL